MDGPLGPAGNRLANSKFITWVCEATNPNVGLLYSESQSTVIDAPNAAENFRVMASYNLVNGLPTHLSPLIDEVIVMMTPGHLDPVRAIVATNARLSDAQVNRVAAMAQAGLTRAIYPAHTMVDGDVVFSLATGSLAGEQNLTVVGALAADVVAEAILRAVRAATAIPGYPAARDIK